MQKYYLCLLHLFFFFFFVCLLLPLPPTFSASADRSFVFDGFRNANLSLNGNSAIESNGILRLTNKTKHAVGHAFFPEPFKFFAGGGTGTDVLSFSTCFVFAIIPPHEDLSSHGLAFVVSPSKEIPGAGPSQYLGLFNLTSNGKASNHIVAVELDTVRNVEYDDINDNHVGIDIDSLVSVSSAPASYAYYDDVGRSNSIELKNLSLISGKPMKVWVEYDGVSMRFNVTLAPIDVDKPGVPLLSSSVVNLSSVLLDDMYVGFSSSTGTATGCHYVLGWSFSLNGRAQELDVSKLPLLPPPPPSGGGVRNKIPKHHRVLFILLPVIIAILLFIILVTGIFLFVKMRRRRQHRFSEKCEDWEVEFGPHRFSYRDLYKATKGFNDENLLGAGGFGGVFKGVLPRSNLEVAVKRVSNGSRQGMKEFVAEIASVGRVRHRNLVQLFGYSRQKEELLLVYEFMPNGSLDKYLFGRPEVLVNWWQRFTIIKGIAAGVLYLHEEWEQVILHRDIKASNVLLDHEFHGKLGDFGLARRHDHGSNPQTTHVIGTFGYLAPELSRTGKATTRSDVFAFGAFCLEVACGKRPVELRTSGVELVLVDWVLDFFKKGEIVEARDRRLGENYVRDEVELVLKLGLICSHPVPTARPSMRQVVQILERELELPALSEEDIGLFESVSRKITFLDGSAGLIGPPVGNQLQRRFSQEQVANSR